MTAFGLVGGVPGQRLAIGSQAGSVTDYVIPATGFQIEPNLTVNLTLLTPSNVLAYIACEWFSDTVRAIFSFRAKVILDGVTASPTANLEAGCGVAGNHYNYVTLATFVAVAAGAHTLQPYVYKGFAGDVVTLGGVVIQYVALPV